MKFTRELFFLAMLAVSANLMAQTPQAVKTQIETKAAELRELKSRAETVTKGIGELANSGKLPSDQESLQLLRRMLDELELIRKGLDKSNLELDELKKLLETQNKGSANLTKDVADLKRTKISNHILAQYRDNNQVGGPTDAFSIRELRIGLTHVIDPQTLVRGTFDFATGTTTNSGQMRDAYARWVSSVDPKARPYEVTFGQFPVAIGNEMEQSATARIFPERVAYNRAFFPGERVRGAMIKKPLDDRWSAHIGGYDALTYDDPEQRAISPGPGNKLGMSGGIRYKQDNVDVGLSGYRGDRAPVQTTRTVGNVTTTFDHPGLTREFVYLDGNIDKFLNAKAFLRFEYMVGRDRVPVTPGANNSVSNVRNRVDVSGGHLVVGYNLNPKNQLAFKWEQFDPNQDIASNTIESFGGAWSYFLNSGARITLSHESFNDPSRAAINNERYHFTTLRVVFKF